MKKQIRVMHLRSSPFLGSPEQMLLNRIEKCDREECEYIVGVFDEQINGKNDFAEVIQRMRKCSFKMRPELRYVLSNVIRIRKIARKYRCQIICSHDYKSNFIAWILRRFITIPVIAIFHGRTQKDVKIKLYHFLDGILIRWFDAIICVSQDISHRLRKIIPKNKRYVIPNAVDIERIQKLSEMNTYNKTVYADNDKKYVVFIGRLSKEKGLKYLIEAGERVLRQFNDVKFLIIGDGPERMTLEKQISERNLTDSIQMLGYKKNVYGYLKRAEFMVLPSLMEGMPVVILEAFALKKPVIASKVGGIPEIVRDRYNGLLVDSGNPDQLASAIKRMLNNSELIKEMGENGYNLVKKNNTIETQIEKYMKVYEEILGKKTSEQMSTG